MALVSSDEPLALHTLSDTRDVAGAELGTLLSGEHGFAQDFIDNVIPHVGLLHVHRAFKTCRALRDAVRAYMAVCSRRQLARSSHAYHERGECTLGHTARSSASECSCRK